MYLKTRTRSDYSTYYSTPQAALAWPIRSHRWVRPLMWVALGFIIGALYGKVLLAPRNETLALVASDSTEKTIALPKIEKAQEKATKSSSA